MVETASVVGRGAVMIVFGCALPGAALKLEAKRFAETQRRERQISGLREGAWAASVWIFLIGRYGAMNSLHGSGNCHHPLAGIMNWGATEGKLQIGLCVAGGSALPSNLHPE